MAQPPNGMLLTGGIGSGKSTAAGLLAGLGATVVSADDAARRVLEPQGSAFGEVVARWPEVARSGQIDRERLAETVFSDPEALAELEAITHPPVGEILAAEVERARDAPLVVLEIPLLRDPLGRGWPVVVVDAPAAVRVSRLRARGMDDADLERRLAAQPSREAWLAAADIVIDNGDGLDRLAASCRRLWQQLTGP